MHWLLGCGLLRGVLGSVKAIISRFYAEPLRGAKPKKVLSAPQTLGLIKLMEDLIPVINRLHDIASNFKLNVDIDLPQIVVVGSQSAGKSSVLESIVGRDFLPRGTGIVTRRPLILQLVRHPTEYAFFLHNAAKRYTDYNEVRKEIEASTDQEAGGKSISPSPINLKIYSPNVLDITLVDLPGLVVNALPGQPHDIEAQVRKMITGFIRPENTLILAVTPANIDIATSKAIQLAQSVDPEGVRTIGVITKIDLMDRGTDASSVLRGEVIPLKLGYIGVLCRSQEDIVNKVNFTEHLQKEESFFSSHDIYSVLPELVGTPSLRKQLNKELTQHIQQALPNLQERLEKLHQLKSAEMATYGRPLCEPDRPKIMLMILNRYAKLVTDRLEGRGYDLNEGKLQGAATIGRVLHHDFPASLTGKSTQMSIGNLRTAIMSSFGYKGSIFMPESLFEKILSERIKQLKPVCLKCVDSVTIELKKLAQLSFPELDHIPELKQKIKDKVSNIVTEYAAKAKKLVKSLVKIEADFVNINHPDFKYGKFILETLLPSLMKNPSDYSYQAARSGLETIQQLHDQISRENTDSMAKLFKSTEDKKAIVIEFMEKLTTDYYRIVLNNLSDTVPKAIVSCLLKRTKESLNTELVNRLYSPRKVDKIMVESPEVTRKRSECSSVLKYTTEAKRALREVKLAL
jgi:GTP-binding protein EngB required for normal cell division